MISLILSVSIELENKRLEAVETKSDEDFVSLVKRVKKFNENKQSGRTWEILEGVNPKIKDYFMQEQAIRKEVRTQERYVIQSYFTEAREAIENLESIWNKNY